MKLGEGELNIFMTFNFVSNFTSNKATDEKLKHAMLIICKQKWFE
jgi:hypothetical protein